MYVFSIAKLFSLLQIYHERNESHSLENVLESESESEKGNKISESESELEKNEFGSTTLLFSYQGIEGRGAGENGNRL
jgi:hypothetical protein